MDSALHHSFVISTKFRCIAFANVIRSPNDNIYEFKIRNKMELLNYINFSEICEDHQLNSGDLSPEDTFKLEEIIKRFISTNK